MKKVKATLYISEDKREAIRSSGLSLEEYFNRIYDTHQRFGMDRWDEGVFKAEYFRVCLLRAETLNSITDRFKDEEIYEVGKEIGEKFRYTWKNSLKHHFTSADRPERQMVNFLNRFTGWGNFTFEGDTIIITQPVFNKPYFLQGYLEGLLNCKQTLVESLPDRLVFQQAN